MGTKQYLNEERYQKNKKKLIWLAFIILIISILGGVSLILTGQQKGKEHELLVQEKSNLIQGKLDNIKIEKEKLEQKISEKNYECNSMDMRAEGWFANVNKCHDEVSNLRKDLTGLNSKEIDLKHEIEENQENPAIIFYVLSGLSIFLGIIISISIFTTAKGREIAAFGAQQMMPIAQEGMDAIAPSIGNIAKEISKGIKNGKE